jgi:hypothetical protein
VGTETGSEATKRPKTKETPCVWLYSLF